MNQADRALDPQKRVTVSAVPLEIGAIIDQFYARQTGDCGAIAHFVGRTRADQPVHLAADQAAAFPGSPSSTSSTSPTSPTAPTSPPVPAMTALELEHYPGMTEKRLAALAEDAMHRFSLLDVAIHHRVGIVPIGNPIVLVIAAAGHRKSSLQSVDFVMDWLKTEAPFWKRTLFDDGTSQWVEAKVEDQTARENWIPS
ncbi:MAG: molybdenum cofactor biosynthesis protein MoaE [Alphaproteobacteria bacterium]|nr:molybdenum cofactor biosynthesis protein MoaE [Alphaproteobacteria bacterium]